MKFATASLGIRLAIVLLAIFTIAPIGFVVWRSVATPSRVTIEHYEKAFTDPVNTEALANTVVI